MTDVMNLADRFFKAIEAGDVAAVRSCFAPDAVIWHNYDGLAAHEKGDSVEDTLKVLEGVPRRIQGARYDVSQRELTETGFVQQHVLKGLMPNGEPIELIACVVCRVENGLIARLDEYFDPGIRVRLYEAVAASEAQ